MKRLSKLQILSLVVLSFLTIAFGVLWLNRIALPYNSEGRYFDEVSTVVYEEQSLIVYGLLTLMTFGLLAVAVIWSVKTVWK